MPNINELNERFAIDNQLEFTLLGANFPVADISNQYATARIALQGAQVMTWAPRNEEPVIWLSTVAKLAPGKSIRGGVPICWPWFGPHQSETGFPGHGYARTVPWQVLESKQLEDNRTQLVFRLQESEATRRYWPHNTPVECRITVGNTLEIELATRNQSQAAITLSEALHTYFMVGDIGEVRVLGLEEYNYLDKVEGMALKTQHGAIRIDNEVDRVYLNTTGECIIEDGALGRRIHIRKQGSASTVVWNPWIEKAAQMGDLGENGYRHMLCVESGNAADNRITLDPGKTHRLLVSYAVERQ